MDFNNLNLELQKKIIEDILTKLKLPLNYYRTTEIVLKSYSNYLSAFGIMDLEFQVVEDTSTDSNISNDPNTDSNMPSTSK